FPLSLALFVAELAVIHDAAYGGLSRGRDFHQVQIAFLGEHQSLPYRHNAQLLAVFGNHPHFAHPNLLVYPKVPANVLPPPAVFCWPSHCAAGLRAPPRLPPDLSKKRERLDASRSRQVHIRPGTTGALHFPSDTEGKRSRSPSGAPVARRSLYGIGWRGPPNPGGSDGSEAMWVAGTGHVRLRTPG